MPLRHRRLPALLATLFAATLAGCTSVERNAADGDYGARLEMYSKNAVLQPEGRLTDPVRAEYWLQQVVQQRAELHFLYAAGLMDGRFGHIDEVAALAEAEAAPKPNKVAQGILDSVAKLKAAEATDFPAWQKLYAETRPLCPDRYAGAASPLDALLAAARGGTQFRPLPDAIQPGMANAHAYLLLVEYCPFSLVEQLDDPAVYAVQADWYASPIVADPKKAAGARSLARIRFPAASAGTAAPADAASIAQVREDLLARYRPLYAPHLTEADRKRTAGCIEALLPVNDALNEKHYDDIVTVARKAAASACSSGYDLAEADLDADLGLSHSGNWIAAIARGLAFLKNDTYDTDTEYLVIGNIIGSMDAQGTWVELDDLVAALKARFPAIQPLKL